jgi:hypothetical protein|tara:strand:- start:1658 stop:1936 length:279 start_codon:yes stop_codon:yes gene_type:complete
LVVQNVCVDLHSETNKETIMNTLSQIQESNKSLEQIVVEGAKLIISKSTLTIERYTTDGYKDFCGDLIYTLQRTKYYQDEVKFWNAVKRYLK